MVKPVGVPGLFPVVGAESVDPNAFAAVRTNV
jgi:hypothetical protein